MYDLGVITIGAQGEQISVIHRLQSRLVFVIFSIPFGDIKQQPLGSTDVHTVIPVCFLEWLSYTLPNFSLTVGSIGRNRKAEELKLKESVRLVLLEDLCSNVAQPYDFTMWFQAMSCSPTSTASVILEKRDRFITSVVSRYWYQGHNCCTLRTAATHHLRQPISAIFVVHQWAL